MERSEPTLAAGFCSVVVITFALHVIGPQFETGRKQRVAFVLLVLKWLSGKQVVHAAKALISW